ncbi:MAG: pantoate--beta-alanine ligase [Fimbriimonas ginsengisoli]|uniref:Pantothenate synthetase n=1 Tax=Fimbriimonas ginsengisoli TaxID=1005039 RepID=A0A931LTG6_FIMGI|nr:pantoate--beta-alanine ligase [Fimbriimonas ginsengisoli]
MGAFHEGHLSLMRRAKAECGFCAVSLFVNPLQFGPNEDYAKYPRNEQRDSELAESAGCDALYMPEASELVGKPLVTIKVADLSGRYEGVSRPGHFDGVATIVCKLFNIVRPSVAYFGLKDLQQCAVVDLMVRDLNLPVALRFCETVREADGLAMSSRNAYLGAAARAKAPMLHGSLNDARSALIQGSALGETLETSRRALEEMGFEVDYIDLVDRWTFHRLDVPGPSAALIAAARIEGTRLIDNAFFEEAGL